jgi:DNA-binding MarR family transcriptional regulator
MCDRLVAKGLVRRRTESDDRRQISVDLTPAGRGLVDAVTARRRQEIRRIVGRIGVGERDVLVHALAQFADAAGEMPDQEWSIGWTGA